MHSHQRAGALAVDIEVSHMEFAHRAGNAVAVSREERTCQPILGIVRNGEGIVKVTRPNNRQYRTKYLFLRQARGRRHICDDRRLDEVALLCGWLATRQ